MNRKKLKRDTKIVIISVIALTILTMRVSYAAFFSVQSKSIVHEITTKELNVTIKLDNAIQNDDLMPIEASKLPSSANAGLIDDSAGQSTNKSYATITLTNTGGYDADYLLSISEDNTNLPSGSSLIDKQYLLIGVYNESGQWINFSGTTSTTTYYKKLSEFTNKSGKYSIYHGSIKNKTGENTQKLRIYVWLDEKTPNSEINKLVKLKLDVQSAVTGAADFLDGN